MLVIFNSATRATKQYSKPETPYKTIKKIMSDSVAIRVPLHGPAHDGVRPFCIHKAGKVHVPCIYGLNPSTDNNYGSETGIIGEK